MARKKSSRKASSKKVSKKTTKKKTARRSGATSSAGAKPKAPPAKTNKPKVVMVPEYDRIAARAFAIWEQKGRPHGQDEQNWREAEAQLMQEMSPA